MITHELLLKVPAQKEIRISIREKTDEYFLTHKVTPPVSEDALSVYASKILEMNSWDSEYQAFVMVCCGSAIWKPVVRSVPYNRRILLLPQCMKNSRLCRGEEDSVGLLCSSCGSCSINGLIDTAEGLGYMTVVSEGTTVASKLIEEGKADAVIGVSCMEVLQKMYSSVTKYAVPGIGIPLLDSGCKDTTADTDWVMDEILACSPYSHYKLLNLNYLRNRTASVFTAVRMDQLLGKAGNITEQLAREYLLTGGKRLRPMLTVLACEAFSRDINEDDLARLALSIECFHKASLIHDDIEDNDLTRYDRETLHARYGVPVAINAGDFLIGEGYRLITETSFEASIIKECIGIAARGHRLLASGQGMELMAIRNRDIFTNDEVIEVFDYKASTAFKVALLLGAVAGGADPSSVKLLEKYSQNIGIAYQIMDDIDDFSDPDGRIDLNKPSVFISLLSERLSEADQVLFQAAYCSHDISIIKAFCDSYQVRKLAAEMMQKYLALTGKCLDEITNPGLKLALHEIIGKVFNKYL